ncbi:MAG: ORF6N domain-containing protein, partial [Ruminococcus sp.]|nr:ORF6N domain-containing protein [Ruminococcus sp.]
MYEIINKVPVKIKEYKGQRVVTFKDIDTIHNRPTGTARRNFNKHKKRFIEGEDYFVRNAYEAKKEFGIIAPNGLILITEFGYLMLVKLFEDDLSWTVQRQLVNTYFKVQSMNIYSDLESIIDKKIDKKIDNALNRTSTDIVKTILPCFEMLYNSIK